MARLRHVYHGDLLVPLRSEPFNPSTWPKAGAFPLFPFHNKLLNASFRFDGREIRLRPTIADGDVVMHGPAHRRSWYVSEQAEPCIEMTLQYRADEDWPFDFRATQRFELCGNSLKIMLCLTNTGSTAMPGGIGWHPYFQPSEEGLIALDAARQWEPFGNSDPSVPIFRRASSIRLTTGRTQHYSDWRLATARIGESARITIRGSKVLTCFAALQKDDYLCLEPVSHIAGALARMDEWPVSKSMHRLCPGVSLSGTILLSTY